MTLRKLLLACAPFALSSACVGTPGPVGNAAAPEPVQSVALEARARELGYDWSLVRLTQQPES